MLRRCWKKLKYSVEMTDIIFAESILLLIYAKDGDF